MGRKVLKGELYMINANKAGGVLAALMGGWHLMWALLVAVGWAQPVINFIFWLHFIKPIYAIAPFEVGTALLLIAITTVLGYAFGFVFGVIWNKLHKA